MPVRELPLTGTCQHFFFVAMFPVSYKLAFSLTWQEALNGVSTMNHQTMEKKRAQTLFIRAKTHPRRVSSPSSVSFCRGCFMYVWPCGVGGGRGGDSQKQEECRFRTNTHIHPSLSFKSDNPHKMKGDSHCSLIPVSCCGPAVHLVPGGKRQVHLMLPHTASLTEAQTRVRASPMLIRKVPHQKSMSV